MHLIIRLEIVSLLHTRVPANWADINHAIPELHKRAPHNRDVQIRNVFQAELDEALVLFVAEPADKGLGGKRDAHSEGRETILGKTEVEHGLDRQRGGSELLLLLGEVGAADVTDYDFVAEFGEELEDFGGGMLETT
jgi:hypothetical protein